jgi:hypothetical protein
MEYCKINGKNYDVIITSIEESFTVLYSENTGRTLGGRMVLDPIGTFFSHKVTFNRSPDNAKAFDDLFDFLSKPKNDGFPVEIIHGQKSMRYDAYVSSGARALKRISKDRTKAFWGELSVTFTPMEAQVLPE